MNDERTLLDTVGEYTMAAVLIAVSCVIVTACVLMIRCLIRNHWRKL